MDPILISHSDLKKMISDKKVTEVSRQTAYLLQEEGLTVYKSSLKVDGREINTYGVKK